MASGGTTSGSAADKKVRKRDWVQLTPITRFVRFVSSPKGTSNRRATSCTSEAPPAEQVRTDSSGKVRLGVHLIKSKDCI